MNSPYNNQDIEQAGPTPQSRNGCLIFCRSAAVVVLFFVGVLGAFFVSGPLVTDVVLSLSSEKVYEAHQEKVNPAYEGKLVRMVVHKISTEGGPVEDKQFGVSREKSIVLYRSYLRENHGRVNVAYTEWSGIRPACFPASDIRAGDYKLKARDDFWDDLGGETIHGDEIRLPEKWEPLLVARSESGIRLRSQDISNLAAPQVTLCFRYVPSPWQGTRFVIGRQRGEELDLTEDGCGLIRGEAAYNAHTHKHPIMILLCGGSFTELVSVQTGALLFIALCLLPATQMLQKRGWARATWAALLLSSLLTFTTAGIWLLMPYSGVTPLAWIYIGTPGLLIAVLLYQACRNRSTNEHKRS